MRSGTKEQYPKAPILPLNIVRSLKERLMKLTSHQYKLMENIYVNKILQLYCSILSVFLKPLLCSLMI